MAALTAAVPRVADRSARLVAAAAALGVAAAIGALAGRGFATGLGVGLAVAFLVAAATTRGRDPHALTNDELARLGDGWAASVDDVVDAAGAPGHVVAGPRGVFRLTSSAASEPSRAPALLDLARGAAWAASGRHGGQRVRPVVVVWGDGAAAATVDDVAVVPGGALRAWLETSQS